MCVSLFKFKYSILSIDELNQNYPPHGHVYGSVCTPPDFGCLFICIVCIHIHSGRSIGIAVGHHNSSFLGHVQLVANSSI